jgi:DNA-binding transcriptional ArsR family regulator
MLDVVDAGRRIEVFIEGKDMETRRFFLAISARGSGEEKFTFAGSVEEVAAAQRATGDHNREAVLAVLRSTPEALATGAIVEHLTRQDHKLSRDTVQKHIKTLIKDGVARSTGEGTATKYFALDLSPTAPSAADEGLR